jgi:hypothetical protein
MFIILDEEAKDVEWKKVVGSIPDNIEGSNHPKSDVVFHIKEGKKITAAHANDPIAFFMLAFPMPFMSKIVEFTNQKLSRESIKLTSFDEVLKYFGIRLLACFYDHLNVLLILFYHSFLSLFFCIFSFLLFKLFAFLFLLVFLSFLIFCKHTTTFLD